jgi:deoxyribodipyrimidine photo-lyase
MRAMVMSFASYHLWLDWRHTGPILARWFTDYEPGIHWTQCQMQSGTTGINTIRIYNPYKQAEEHDAAGAFVRRWVPELAALSDADLIRPEQTPLMMQQTFSTSDDDASRFDPESVKPDGKTCRFNSWPYPIA